MKGVFSDPAKLRLPNRLLDRSLEPLISMLETHKTGVGSVLLTDDRNVWTAQDVNEVQALVFRIAPDQRARIDYLRILNSACLSWSAAHRCDIKAVPIPKLRVKTSNPHTRNLVGDRRTVREWRQILSHIIDRIAEADDPGSAEYSELTFCALIVSAIVYGGLLSSGGLAALVRAFPSLRNVTIIADGRVHVELSLSRYGLPDAEFHRWQPDVLSATLWLNSPSSAADCLLSEVEEKGERRPPRDSEIFQRISEQFKRLPAKLGEEGSYDLTALIRSTAGVATFEVGSPLKCYATGELPSVSMTRPALQRFTRDEIEISPKTVSTIVNYARPIPEWANTLLAGFTGDDRTVVITRLARIASETTSAGLLERFADFGDFLLRTTALSGRRMTVKEAKRAVKAIIEQLANYFDGRDPGAIDSQTLGKIYVDAMRAAYDRSASQSSRRRLFSAIQEFDRYLVHNCGKAPVSPKCNLLGWRELAKVDANPITFETYEKILKRIDDDQKASREQRTIGMLLVVLAFRTGLRRLECLLPRIQDFLMRTSMELLVRGHKLKSVQARRRARLKSLSEGELTKLIEWILERLDEVQGAIPEDFLFGNSKEKQTLIPESIFDWIIGIMREVTGDPTITYHQFRHSFAGFLFFSLMLSDHLDVIPDVFPHHDLTRPWLNESRARHTMVYGNPQPTKRHLFFVAREMGHLSPTTSANWYIHFFDWMLRIALDQSRFLRPDIELARKASRISRAILKRWETSNNQTMCIPINIWFSRFPELRRKLEADRSGLAQDRTPDSEPSLIGEIEHYLDPEWKFLWRCQTENAWDDLSPADKVRLQNYRDNIGYLFSLKRGEGALRHRKQNTIPDKRFPDQVRIIALPRRPIAEEDLVPDCLGKALDTLRDNDSDLFRKGLEIFVHRVEENNFVRFASPNDEKDAHEAFEYLRFLEALGFECADLRIVSGDRAERSNWRSRWRNVLDLRDYRIPILRPQSSDYFGRKSALSIRPAAMKGHDFAGGAGFRFAMAMAFVVYRKRPRPDVGKVN